MAIAQQTMISIKPNPQLFQGIRMLPPSEAPTRRR
jgi:hypothetical protein